MQTEIAKQETAKTLLETIEAHKQFVQQVEHFIATQAAGYKYYPYNQVVYFPKFFLTVATNEGGKGSFNIKGAQYHIGNRTIPETFVDITANALCRHITNGHGESPISEPIWEYMPKYLIFLKEQIENMQTLLDSI